MNTSGTSLNISMTTLTDDLDIFTTNITQDLNISMANVTRGLDPYEEYLQKVMSWNEIINCLFISCCLPFILGGNIMIILSVIKFHRLQTVMNLFILSLAFSDLLVGFPTIPFYITFFVNKEVHWIKYLCLLKYVFVLISLPASILNLLIVTVDRFIAVIYPLRYKILMTKKRARILIVIVWIYSVGSATMPLMGLNSWLPGLPCDFWQILPKWFTMMAVPGIIALCLPTTILMYIKIFSVARKSEKRINKFKTNMQLQSRKLKHDVRSAKIMAFVFLLFILFWLPFLMASLLKYLNFHFLVIEMVKICTVSLAMANSLVNPIIYCWVRVDFRNAFKKLLRINETNLPQEEEYNLNQSSNSNRSNSIEEKMAPVQSEQIKINGRTPKLERRKSDGDLYISKTVKLAITENENWKQNYSR